MDASLQFLLSRLEQLSDQFRELRDGVQKAIHIADADPEMALTRARKVLEYVVRDVYERRVGEPPGTRPLENLLQRLVKEGHFPDRLDAYASAIRKLGNVGTHSFGEKVAVADVYQSLAQLMPILEWYFEVERPEALPQPHAEARDSASHAPEATYGRRVASASAAPSPCAAVVPKGLRSFDGHDADFFMELLPGPRDKEGLPESIRFWKHRIESRGEPAFTVGVIYGPSGCGKSSLVKAGLLPRLGSQILPVYVEATATDTESKLLHALRKRLPDLACDLDLPGSLMALRHGRCLRDGQKLLIVVDQLEQWLHANRGEQNTELAQALRQCDGEGVQCLLLVRDDFWLALARFMDELHIELLQGQNIALVDLFDLSHARNVLSAFGRALGRLPRESAKEHESFLDRAVRGLSQDGRVISVRLALFAEMVKSRPWTSATLKAVGGTEGVGAAFLEETFCAAGASSKNRRHQAAARAVLRSLLPEQGSDIKGNMRSGEELLHASGYTREPREFAELLRMLDSELRLVTPTDADGAASDDGAASQDASSIARLHYQLTHDYLVPSLREWLARKQKESRRGRAELRLAGLAAQWSAFPAKRQLPAWWEWLNVRLFTRPRDWTAVERTMMHKAARRHAIRGLALLLLLSAMVLTGMGLRSQIIEQNRATHAADSVHRLLDAEIAQVPSIVQELRDYRVWTEPLLKQAYREAARTEAAAQPQQRKRALHASLALLADDPIQIEYLYGRLLEAEPQEVAVIREALTAHQDKLTDRLWTVVADPQAGHESQRLRAAAALALFDPASARWERVSGKVAGQLVSVSPVFLATWMDELRPVKEKLFDPLVAEFRNRATERTAERTLAMSILADYASDQADAVADLVMEADEKQFPVLFPKLASYREAAISRFGEELAKPIPVSVNGEDRDAFAKRQANAAIGLILLDRPEKAWPLLRQSPDPSVRSYLIHRANPLGVPPSTIVERLAAEQDVSARRALLLILAELGADRLPPVQREAVVHSALEMYHGDPDPGIHGAAASLLAGWTQRRPLADIKGKLASGQAEGSRRWYVNGEGQTLAVIPGPTEFVAGSPPTEDGREGGEEGTSESQHRARIDRSFAIGMTEVTVEQFLRHRKDHPYNKQYAPTSDCPINCISWYDAAAYCNWLSQREGITTDQLCYLPNAAGKYSEGMKIARDYLGRTGYRLPTEAEWEFACRAGAATSRYFGDTEELLDEYAWHVRRSKDRRTLPVASLKPNDFGLFDMLGNAWEWCADRYAPDATALESQDQLQDPRDNEGRVLRGGSLYRVLSLRSADRDKEQPANRDNYIGFRVARTIGYAGASTALGTKESRK